MKNIYITKNTFDSVHHNKPNGKTFTSDQSPPIIACHQEWEWLREGGEREGKLEQSAVAVTVTAKAERD